MSIVGKGNFNIIQKIESDLWKKKAVVSDESIRYIFKLDTVRITVYKSNKVMFQGKDENYYYEQYFGAVEITNKDVKIENKNNINFPIIGSDEVGVGDYFGPLVVGAAYVNEEINEKIKALGIRDSKKLTDDKIVEIANKLEKIVPIEVCIMSSEKYNHLTEQKVNAHMIKAILHNEAHIKLHKKFPDSTHVIDQFVKSETYYKYLKTLNTQALENIYFETKAEDKYIAVACGAIIARKYFLIEIKKISDQFGINIPLGAGSKVDEVICEIREQFGEEKLKSISKYHFANTDKTK